MKKKDKTNVNTAVFESVIHYIYWEDFQIEHIQRVAIATATCPSSEHRSVESVRGSAHINNTYIYYYDDRAFLHVMWM